MTPPAKLTGIPITTQRATLGLKNKPSTMKTRMDPCRSEDTRVPSLPLIERDLSSQVNN